jgi:hypothetical protein
MPDADLAQRAKNLLDELAQTPRFAGSAEESRARALCRLELERGGFDCKEILFEYSQAPGRWGPPLAAAAQVLTAIVVAETVMDVGAFWALMTGAGLVAVFILADANAKKRAIERFPLQRARSVNLEAKRGNPTAWLVAHLDSKSQTVPMLFRIASSVTLAAVLGVMLIALLLSMAGMNTGRALWVGLEIAAIVVAIPSLLCFVKNDSNGAVDNVSGVVAVLLAAQSAASPSDLGVLITSGEELGLAGARIWAHTARPGVRILNCDTVDDRGGWRCMYTGPKPKRLALAAESVGRRQGVGLSVGRLIPGILADSIAFADLGIEGVTLSRGTLSTLARIHTRRDTSNALTGKGAAEASAILSALAKELG